MYKCQWKPLYSFVFQFSFISSSNVHRFTKFYRHRHSVESAETLQENDHIKDSMSPYITNLMFIQLYVIASISQVGLQRRPKPFGCMKESLVIILLQVFW